jgi:transcriptional regulator with XRE-family HTH domain
MNNKLKEALEELGISPKQFAEEIDSTTRTVNSWLKGKPIPEDRQATVAFWLDSKGYSITSQPKPAGQVKPSNAQLNPVEVGASITGVQLSISLTLEAANKLITKYDKSGSRSISTAIINLINKELA